MATPSECQPDESARPHDWSSSDNSKTPSSSPASHPPGLPTPGPSNLRSAHVRAFSQYIHSHHAAHISYRDFLRNWLGSQRNVGYRTPRQTDLDTAARDQNALAHRHPGWLDPEWRCSLSHYCITRDFQIPSGGVERLWVPGQICPGTSPIREERRQDFDYEFVLTREGVETLERVKREDRAARQQREEREMEQTRIRYEYPELWAQQTHTQGEYPHSYTQLPPGYTHVTSRDAATDPVASAVEADPGMVNSNGGSEEQSNPQSTGSGSLVIVGSNGEQSRPQSSGSSWVYPQPSFEEDWAYNT